MKMIDDFHKFIARLDDEDLAAEYQIVFVAPDPAADVARLAQRIGMPVAQSYADLLSTKGAFHHAHYGDTWQTLRFYSAQEMLDCRNGLVDFIDDIWSGRPELEDALTSASIAKLNAEYIVFGYRYQDDNVHDYLFFDRHGDFHHLLFDQDDTTEAEKMLNKLAQQTVAGISFEALLNAQFDSISKAIEEDNL
jgi:hypothetical protein